MLRVDGQASFVLHARPWRETSLLLEVFSQEFGRVGLVARGVRRERSRFPRALLQPLQPLLLGWVGGGELATLSAVEAVAGAFEPTGDALLATMYLNELVSRLSARNDPHPDAFAAYTQCLARLAAGEPIGWTLRRFERDLLADLGFAMVLETTANNDTALDAGSEYRYDVDAGPWLLPVEPNLIREPDPWPRISGRALLALAADTMPDAAALAQLRRLMRAIIGHQLGGKQLNSWQFARAPG